MRGATRAGSRRTYMSNSVAKTVSLHTGTTTSIAHHLFSTAPAAVSAVRNARRRSAVCIRPQQLRVQPAKSAPITHHHICPEAVRPSAVGERPPHSATAASSASQPRLARSAGATPHTASSSAAHPRAVSAAPPQVERRYPALAERRVDDDIEKGVCSVPAAPHIGAPTRFIGWRPPWAERQ